MEYKIEKRKAFKIAGIIHQGCNIDSHFTEFWDELYQKISFDKLKTMGDSSAYGCSFPEQGKETFSYVPSYDVKDVKLAQKYGLDIIEIPETLYAIIQLRGKVPYCIKEGWQFVMKELLNKEAEGYERTLAPDFEVYSKGDMYSNFYEMELWIPIKPKN